MRRDELDHVVFYDKPFLKFERLVETYIALAPRVSLVPHGDPSEEKLFQKNLLKREFKQFAS